MIIENFCTMKSNYIKKTNKWDVGFVFVLALLSFTLGFCSQEFINFETRFALFAQDVFRHGLKFYPTIYGVPYPDYPALSTWLIYFSQMLFAGHLVKFATILPTAIASAGIAVFTYLIAALYSRRWAWYAVLMLFITVYFVQSARTISVDQCVSLVTVMLSYYLIRLCVYQNDFSWRSYCLIAGILFVGVWFRGPLGLVIPSAAAVAIFLAFQQYKKLVIFGLLSFLILLLSCAGLLGLAYCQGGMEFLRYVLVMQVANRMQQSSGNPHQWFYLKSLFVDYMPSFGIAFGAAVLAFPKYIKYAKERKLLWALLLIIIIVALGMSIPGDKKTRYLLPLVPAMALLASWLWLDKDVPGYIAWFRNLVSGIFYFVPVLLCVALSFAQQRYHDTQHELLFLLDANIEFVYVLCVGVFVLQTAYFFARKNLKFRYEFVLFIGMAMQIIAVQILITQPVQLYLNHAQEFVEQVEALRQPGQTIYFYKITHDGGDNSYFLNSGADFVPAEYLALPSELDNLPNNSLVLMHKKEYIKLNEPVRERLIMIEPGHFGRHDAVALEIVQ